MKRWAYYNDSDPQKCAWISELIKAKVITDGEVDSRSIKSVTAADVRGFRRCHFFAGIAVWDYALRLAGFPDERSVWTGSCPCPSFSAAGKGQGFGDARHLWPDWMRLIGEYRPATIFSEQVDDAIGHGWLDLVQADLEKVDYAVGKVVLGACAVGAPHRRQRLYFVADRYNARLSSEPQARVHAEWECGDDVAGRGESRELADTERGRREQRDTGLRELQQSGASGDLGDTAQGRFGMHGSAPGNGGHAAQSTAAGFWSDAVWIYCRDGKYRPTKPGLFPLVNGTAARVAKLRGLGDAIIPQVAAEFIQAFLETGKENC